MSPKKYNAPAVCRLAAVVDEIAPRDPGRWEDRRRVPGADGLPIQVSQVRGRQLWALVGMFDRAVGRLEVAGGRVLRSVERLFDAEVLDAVWELAVDGELRARGADVGKRLPLATRRVVRDCLGLLAGVVVPDKAVRLPSVPEAPLRATTSPSQEAELFRFLAEVAGRAPVGHGGQSKAVNEHYRVRLLAMTAVVLDTRSRPGELAAMRVDDLGEGFASVRVRRRQQNGAHLEAVEVTLPLEEGTVVALRRWLKVRETLVYSLQGAADALWVSVAASRRGEPPGIPLSPRSLSAAYTRGVRQLNGFMAGAPGWEPLPPKLEGLRRALLPAVEAEERRVRADAVAASRPVALAGRPPGSGGPVRHGRESTYVNLECRCVDCTQAATNARQARRREAGQ